VRARGGERTRWYRVPVVWVGVVALVASLGGSVYNIIVSLQLADNALTEVAPKSRFGLVVDEDEDEDR